MNKVASSTLFSKELLLLLALIQSGSKHSLHEERLSGIDWSRFLDLTAHHRVFPLILPRLNELDPSYVPGRIIQSLTRRCYKNTLKMLHLSGEMERITTKLSAGGIRSILLKGPALAVELYGDLSQRASKDLDILVPYSDLNQVEYILLEMGYIKDPYPGLLSDHRLRGHHEVFLHPGSKVCIEVHWRLHPGLVKEPGFDELWQRKRLCPLTSQPMYTLGKEDLWVYLVYHGARHGWFRLRWLVDIDRLARQQLDWNQVKDLLDMYEMTTAAGQAMRLASELFHTPMVEPLRRAAEEPRSVRLAEDVLFYIGHSVNLQEVQLPADVARHYKKYLFSMKSTRQKLLYLVTFLYPSPADVQLLPLPSKLHFLYIVLRPFLSVWRTVRGWVSPQGGH